MPKFLKSLKSITPVDSPRYQLHRHLSGPEPARSLKRLHASELTKEGGICPRFYALADVTHFKPKDKWLTTSEQVTYHMGRVLQDSVVGWFADMNKAWCHWKCVACGTQHDFQLRPIQCKTCGCRKFDPIEVRFESAECGASCGVDMLLIRQGGNMRVHELKTMDKDQFKDLKAPLAEHRWRTNLYLRLIAESENPWAKSIDTTTATILYISKGGYGCSAPDLKDQGLSDKFSPFKEYTVERDDKETDVLVRRASAVKKFRAGAKGMPFGVCATAMDKRALACPLRAACFSGVYQPIFDWRKEIDQ